MEMSRIEDWKLEDRPIQIIPGQREIATKINSRYWKNLLNNTIMKTVVRKTLTEEERHNSREVVRQKNMLKRWKLHISKVEVEWTIETGREVNTNEEISLTMNPMEHTKDCIRKQDWENTNEITIQQECMMSHRWKGHIEVTCKITIERGEFNGGRLNF